MKEENVSLAELRQHPNYIRSRKNAEYVTQLSTVLIDAGKWIFPPLDLQPVAATEEAYQKDGIRYYIIDGTNRTAAAIEAEWKHKIPARIHPPMTTLDAIALQVKTNMAHGLRLSLADQTAAIKKLRELGMQGKVIAEKTGLHPSSVSRIVSDKQRQTSSGEPGNKDVAGKTNKKPVKPFKVDAWMKSLGKVLKGWEKHGSKIRKAGFPDACGEALDTIVEEIEKAEK